VTVLTRRQNLKRVEVIEDDESEIVEAVRRMSDRYDFVVTRCAPKPATFVMEPENTHADVCFKRRHRANVSTCHLPPILLLTTVNLALPPATAMTTLPTSPLPRLSTYP